MNQPQRHIVIRSPTFHEPTRRSVFSDDFEISRDRLRMVLNYRHLPKMADYGLIEYNLQAETIRYQSSDRLEVLLDVTQRGE